MTAIAFHVHLADRLGYACRLLRKASASGARVVVTGPLTDLRALDGALWTFSPQDFLPHGMADAMSPQLLARTPIVLSTAVDGTPHRQVLVNLGIEVPQGYEDFQRLIELVPSDEASLHEARVRWKHYAARGHALTRFDTQEAAA